MVRFLWGLASNSKFNSPKSQFHYGSILIRVNGYGCTVKLKRVSIPLWFDSYMKEI